MEARAKASVVPVVRPVRMNLTSAQDYVAKAYHGDNV
jgi:hypothetical protein